MEEIIAKIMEFISNPTVVMVLAAVVEFGLRFIKSEKPLSIIYGVAKVVKMIGSSLVIIGEFLDKVIGQRTK